MQQLLWFHLNPVSMSASKWAFRQPISPTPQHMPSLSLSDQHSSETFPQPHKKQQPMPASCEKRNTSLCLARPIVFVSHSLKLPYIWWKLACTKGGSWASRIFFLQIKRAKRQRKSFPSSPWLRQAKGKMKGILLWEAAQKSLTRFSIVLVSTAQKK